MRKMHGVLVFNALIMIPCQGIKHIQYSKIDKRSSKTLKGQCHEIFDLRFLHQTLNLDPLSGSLGWFWFLLRFGGDIHWDHWNHCSTLWDITQINDPHCGTQYGSVICVEGHNAGHLSMLCPTTGNNFPCFTRFSHVFSMMWDIPTTQVICLCCGTQCGSLIRMVSHNTDKFIQRRQTILKL